MKNELLHLGLIFVVFLANGCREEEVPVLTGDIIGEVSVYDGYGAELPDKSGVEVQLTRDGFSMEKSTDSEGRYTFEGVPFGIYSIHLVKDNYVESFLDFRLSHVGGDAPTITSQTLSEIPDYKLDIDSLTYNGSNKLNIYFRAIEASKPFESSRIFVHCFFSQSPDVSYQNYENSFIERAYNGFGNSIFGINWWWWDRSYNFLNNYAGTIYCRIYPQVYCQEMFPSHDLGPYDVLPETLGRPSEVFEFTIEEILRDF